MSETRLPSNVIPPFTLDIPMPSGVKPPRPAEPVSEAQVSALADELARLGDLLAAMQERPAPPGRPGRDD